MSQETPSSGAIERLTSAWLSFILSGVVLALKFWAYFHTGSSAVLSDAMESIVNVVASVLALIIMREVAAPADEEHPYGHGKLEYFSSAFEGGLIAFAALVIGYDAGKSLFSVAVLHQLDQGIVLMAVAGVINLALALHLLAVGKRSKSEALTASGQHVMSDVVTTVGVLLGLALVKITGWLWVDPLIAILVAIHLLYAGAKIVRRSIGGLIDEMEPKALEEMAHWFQAHRRPGIIDIHHLRAIRSGRFHHVDAHIVVPLFWDVATTHRTTHDLEQAVVAAYSYDGEIAFHVDPCNQEWCSRCELQDCTIRLRPFIKLREFTAQSLIKGPEKDL